MANNFANDPDCLALYRFESGALTTDSKGSNTLSTLSDPAADTSNYKEGAASVDLDGNDGLYRVDADLPSDWPFKNGTTNRIMSLAGWFRMGSIPGADNNHLAAKCRDGSASFSLHNYNGDLRLHTYYVGSYNEWTICSMDVANRWYHIGLSFDGNTGEGDATVRFYDSVLDTATTYTTTFSHLPIIVSTANFTIGYIYWGSNLQFLTGQVDELVVFKDIKTVSQFDEIRMGTYGTQISKINSLLRADCSSVNGLESSLMLGWNGLE